MSVLRFRRSVMAFSLLAGAFLILYWALQSKSYVYDSCGYSLSIKYGNDLFHPHHLIYNFVMHWIYVVVSRFSSFEAMTVASAFNGLAMAANVLLVGFLCRKLTGHLSLSLATAAFYGVSYAPLFVATSVEVYPWNILFDLLGFSILARKGAPTAGWAWLVGMLAGLAGLFHQTAVFAALALLGLLIWGRARAGVCALYATAAALTCGLPYLAVARQAGLATPRGLVQYLLAYAMSPEYHAGVWGHGFSLQRVPMALYGLVTTFAYPKMEYLAPFTKMESWGLNYPSLRALFLLGCLLGLVGIALLGGVRLLWQSERRSEPGDPADRPILLSLWAWLISHSAFTLWWNSDNLEFWLMSLAPFLILFAYRVNQCTRPIYSTMERGLLLGLFAVVNLGFRILPDSQESECPVYQSVTALGCSRLGDGDWFIGVMPEMEPCVRYRCGRALQFHSLSYEFYDTPAQKEEVRRTYAQNLATAVREHQVYLQEEELTPARLMETAGWTLQDAQAMYAPYLVGAQVVSSYEREGQRFRLLRLAQPQVGGGPVRN